MPNPSEENKAKSPKAFSSMTICFAVFVLFYVGWLIIALIVFFRADDAAPVGGIARLGTLGDSFGVLNALFSGAALLFVAYTILQQQRLIEQGQIQLEMQKGELQQNTTALNEQRAEMQVQNRFLARQALQNQIFQLLNSWRQYADGSEAGHVIIDVTGQLQSHCVSSISRDAMSRVIADTIALALNDRRKTVAVRKYFALLFEVMHLIEHEPYRSDLGQQKLFTYLEKYQFMRMVHAHMSDVESLLLIFYMHTNDNDVLRRMVFTYKLYDINDMREWFPPELRAYLLEYGADEFEPSPEDDI